MLTEQEVLQFIKTRLGVPYTKIELFDEDIMNYIKTFTLKEFSIHYPTVITYRYPEHSDYIQQQNARHYKIFVESDRKLVDIRKVYGQRLQGNVIPTPNPDQVLNYMLDEKNQNLLGDFGGLTFSYKFEHPNDLYFMGQGTPGQFTIELELQHNFETIPAKMESFFLELCLAEAKIIIGAARDNLETIQTDLGPIQINKELKGDGEQKKQELIQKLEENTWAGTVFEWGGIPQ